MKRLRDGLSIFVFGRALLNWPRVKKYNGAELLPTAMREDSSYYVYSDWEIFASADTVEGFVGICVGRPSAPSVLSSKCEDTIGVLGYSAVRASRLRHA